MSLICPNCHTSFELTGEEIIKARELLHSIQHHLPVLAELRKQLEAASITLLQIEPLKKEIAKMVNESSV